MDDTQRTRVMIPLGHETVPALIPNLIAVARPPYTPGVADRRAEIARALREPIGAAPLSQVAKGRKNAVIVVNDITRPYPGGELVLEIARALNDAGMPDERIFLLVAYGMHRINTDEELTVAYGAEVLERFRIVHHDAQDPARNVTVGFTKGGVEVSIDRFYAQADMRILTGCIAPHQYAGFSGGRKSIIPGIAGVKAIMRHHSFPIRPEKISLGCLEGNRFHEEAQEAAQIAGVDYIVNVVENPERELVRCVAGDLKLAFEEGARISRTLWSVPIVRQPKIVIVSPGGFPRDIDLHQSQKALGCAEMVCPAGGGVILCARCPDGAGKPGALLAQAENAQSIIDDFMQNGWNPNGNGKAYMLARAITRFHTVLAGSAIPNSELHSMFLDGFPTVEDAVDHMLKIFGPDAPVLLIPNASEIIPFVERRS